MTAEFIPVTDPRWKGFLGEVRHDFYHTPEYLDLSGRYEVGEPAAFWAENGRNAFLVPLLRRKIPALFGAPQDWWDLITPYGYTSPLLQNGDAQEFDFLLAQLLATCRESNCVSAFLRLHPLMPLPEGVLTRFGTVVRHGETIFIDLEESEETIWKGVRENHRRDIRKLEKKGFTIEFDNWNRLDAFVGIYLGTMRRLGADPFYLLPPEYFLQLKDSFAKGLHLCTVLSPAGEVASAGLFAGTDWIVEYHLGGTAEEFLSLAPSKLMFDFMWRWGQREGYRVFHLGGGLGCRADSLFRFKEGFSRRRADFMTARIVIDQEKYACLLQQSRGRGGVEDADFFPAYRRPTLTAAGNS